MADSVDKLRISAFSALSLMAILKFVNIGGISSGTNRVLQIVIFFAFSVLTMPDLNKDTLLKVKYALYGSLIAFFVTSPEIGEIVGRYINGNRDYNGFTTQGLIVHGLLYTSALFGVMYLPEARAKN